MNNNCLHYALQPYLDESGDFIQDINVIEDDVDLASQSPLQNV
jgi:hypothetical protein